MNFELLGIANIAAITIICFLIGLGWKTIDKLDNKYIPVVAGLAGGVLGVVAFLTHMPNFPAVDILNAIAIGIVSGLAATGIDQIGKQLRG